MPASEEYKYIRATVTDGQLHMDYLVEGAFVAGSDTHDEDVSDWTEEDIIECVMMTLGAEEKDRPKIEVHYD